MEERIFHSKASVAGMSRLGYHLAIERDEYHVVRTVRAPQLPTSTGTAIQPQGRPRWVSAITYSPSLMLYVRTPRFILIFCKQATRSPCPDARRLGPRHALDDTRHRSADLIINTLYYLTCLGRIEHLARRVVVTRGKRTTRPATGQRVGSGRPPATEPGVRLPRRPSQAGETPLQCTIDAK